MEEKDKETEKILLPHHEQQKLCLTRLPYRQGRKLTAVKVYSITNESNHLLIFGVPSLNLRQEVKALFIRFGKLLQFNVSKDHAAEVFTETYHAHYDRIQSARIAKRLMDTKNFYGGSLHVCYAPEMETVDETHQKLIQRQRDVLSRLRNLHNEETKSHQIADNKYVDTKADTSQRVQGELLNMGEVNIINCAGENNKYKRRNHNSVVIEKRFKPCFIDEQADHRDVIHNEVTIDREVVAEDRSRPRESANNKVQRKASDVTEVEVVDCTSVHRTVVSNISEALNYQKFGDECVYKIPTKPLNKIKFNVNKKSLIYSNVLFLYLKKIGYLHVLEWRPRFGQRSVGRPQARWSDDIRKVAGSGWMLRAEDRERSMSSSGRE